MTLKRLIRNRFGEASAARVVSLTLALLAQSASAGSREGCAAYLRGDYAVALREFLPSANKGDAAAQIAVGWLYDNGLSVAHDDAVAAKWYLLAAKQGDARAQQYLGTMYATGEGVPKDLKTAEHWFRLAAEQGSSGGQFGLGVLYRDGIVVPKDAVESYKWFSLAATSGNSTPEGEQAVAAKNVVAAAMTAEQIAQGDARVKAWKPAGPIKLVDLCK